MGKCQGSNQLSCLQSLLLNCQPGTSWLRLNSKEHCSPHNFLTVNNRPKSNYPKKVRDPTWIYQTRKWRTLRAQFTSNWRVWSRQSTCSDKRWMATECPSLSNNIAKRRKKKKNVRFVKPSGSPGSKRNLLRKTRTTAWCRTNIIRMPKCREGTLTVFRGTRNFKRSVVRLKWSTHTKSTSIKISGHPCPVTRWTRPGSISEVARSIPTNPPNVQATAKWVVTVPRPVKGSIRKTTMISIQMTVWSQKILRKIAVLVANAAAATRTKQTIEMWCLTLRTLRRIKWTQKNSPNSPAFI